MKSLRGRLIAVYVAATVFPLALTVWTSIALLDLSLNLRPMRELDSLSKSFERVGREYYQRAREALRDEAKAGRVAPRLYAEADAESWPQEVQDFWDSEAKERFETAGRDGKLLEYFERGPKGVRVYTGDLAIGREEFTREFAEARDVIASAKGRDLRRGFVYTFVAVASAVWIAGLVGLIYFAGRLTAPVRALTDALRAVGRGDMAARVDRAAREDEIGGAIEAFNSMADQLRDSREKLIHVTRLESWQALARKTAHEIKNSLTPIRLTMEEIGACAAGPDADFLRQAAQIVVDEVGSLEKRVRAFSEFAAEPPVTLAAVDVGAVVEERAAFLGSGHPDVTIRVELAETPMARADLDLIRGVITNLVKNGAEAAGAGGTLLLKTGTQGGRVTVEVHDSGPGLSEMARSTLFEPSISFKKGGMGLGLSIARKSVAACGGEIALIQGELGGAGFRVTLAADGTTSGAGARQTTQLVTK
ncbi:MAG: HAMP domain-containing histidine kinase [Acidobacteria bacterium]|nr:HAMP domain-containing histidine kinase [Acidobacteriota bacterium]